ncbi:hypothetical protein M1N16_08720 [Nitrospinaceae bacterium]|nr:hypothetical protein [Nitrospinaceae bacterium]
MNSLMRFNQFSEKPLHEKRALQNINYFLWDGRGRLNHDLNHYKEDISSSTKKKMMIQLEKLLKSHDYYFIYSDDSRSYNKGRDEQEEIERLVKEIDTADGKKDALKLYRKYLRKNESMHEDQDKMDIHLSISGDCLKKLLGDEKEKKKTKKEKAEEDEIVNVKPKIKKNEHYEKARTLEQTVARKFGASTVLPETVGIEHTGSLNEIRPVGAKGTSYFTDGQLYSGFNFHRPTPKLRSMDEKHLERTSKFGKVYK